MKKTKIEKRAHSIRSLSIKWKRGISPVVATSLLIALVFILALIVFLWFRGFSQEAITKFGDQNIQAACGNVKLDVSYSSPVVVISNSGDVPINKIKIQFSDSGTATTEDLEGFGGLPIGGVETVDISKYNSASKIILIPVLLGNSNSGKQNYICDKKYGYEVNI
ncbi:MAG: hypothetical protein Q7S56_04095 [Nanoarchaeota archaeon]|nr:hypothetical protein [Nanoarchaeota archaeon]